MKSGSWMVLGWGVVLVFAAACGSAGGGGDKLTQGTGATGNGGGSGSDGLGDGMFGESGQGGDVGGFGDRQPDGGCNSLTVQFEELNPTVVLLLDRSGSMWDASYGSAPTRWQAIYEVLTSTSSPIATLEDRVRWGFTAYTNDGNNQSSVCPLLNSVGVKFGNFGDITGELDALNTTGRPTFKAETPTGESLRQVTQDLLAVTEVGPKFIILATDGEPDDCRTNDPQCGQDLSIKAVQDAYDQGIGTFVIGIGNEVGARHLGDLANAGSGQAVQEPDQQYTYNCINPGYASLTAAYSSTGGNATFYTPADQAALENDLREIIGSVRTCNFELNAEVDVDRAFMGSVVLDGADLRYDEPDGWRMVNETQLEITGAACQSILTESKSLDITFPCDVAVIIK